MLPFTERFFQLFPRPVPVLTPLGAAVAAVPDSIAAAFAFIGSFATGGRIEAVPRIMEKGFRSFEYIPSLLFASIMQLNRKSEIDPFIGSANTVANYVWATYEKGEPNRKGLLRLLVTLLFARIVDALIATLAVATSLLTLGYYEKANEIAYDHLTGFFGMIGDITTISIRLLYLRDVSE